MFCLITLVLLAYLRIPPPSEAERHEPARRWRRHGPAGVHRRRDRLGLGYGVMNLLMTATPLAMGLSGHAWLLGRAGDPMARDRHVRAFVLHRFLIKRFGVLRVMLTGVALEGLCVGIALSGVLVANFWWALTLLGVGWNFLYVGGTTLLTDCHRVSEKAKAQGTHDFLVFLTTATSSFSSGLLMDRSGWEILNYAALPALGVIGAAIAWLALRRRAAAAA